MTDPRWPGMCEPDDGCGLSVEDFVELQRLAPQPAGDEGTEGRPNITPSDLIAILAAILPLLGAGANTNPLFPG